MSSNIYYTDSQKNLIFSFFIILTLTALTSCIRLFFDLNVLPARILISFFEASSIILISYLVLFIKKSDTLFAMILLYLKAHAFSIIFQAFFYPDMQYYVANFWGTDVFNNFSIYNYRFIGLAGSYVPASILSSFLLLIYLFPNFKINVATRYFYISLALISSSLTARTGIVLCLVLIFLSITLAFLTSKNAIIKSLLIFLFVLLVSFSSFNTFNIDLINKMDLGIIYQLSYLKTDIASHFSNEWRGDLSFLHYILGTGSIQFSPGDNGYTMFISQHGIVFLILFFIPYLYLLSTKNLTLGLAFGIVIILAQLKTDFFLSSVYMFITLSLIKNY